MITKKLRELYCVDTISQDKGWKKVHEAISGINEDIEIDFSGVNVIDPWQCEEFKELLKAKHVFMKFINNEEIVNRIKMMCIIDGLDETRISNVVVEVPKKKTPEEIKIEHYGNELIPYFDITEKEGNLVATIDLAKKYSQIQSTNTLSYVDYAIREIHNVQAVDYFVLKLGNLVVLHNVLQVIADMMVQYEIQGFHLFVDCDSKDMANDMGLFIYNATNEKYDNDQRRKIIESKLKKGTPGMLIRYKKSKAKDEFGREGKGEVVSSRIAIFRGIEKDKLGNPAVKIETFNNNYFYTREQWMVEHDYEKPSDLHQDTEYIQLDEIGITSMFLGSRYHFILPIQQELSENKMVIEGFDENGSNIKKMCTIPERMKIVFDSWGIDYDKESLEESIKQTKELLENKKNNKQDKEYIQSVYDIKE